MQIQPCPRCGSRQTTIKDTGRRCGAVIGLTAGAASGATGAIYGARTGMALGVLAGPTGSALGIVAGAILGALAGGTAGCVTGIAVGKVIDDNLLGNRSCKRCGHVYTVATAVPEPSQRDLFEAEELDPHDPDYPYGSLPYQGHPGGSA